MLLRKKILEDWSFQKIPQHVSSDNKTVMRSVLNANPEYFFHTHKSQADLFFSIKTLLSAMIKNHTEVVEFILEKTKAQQKSSRLEEIKL